MVCANCPVGVSYKHGEVLLSCGNKTVEEGFAVLSPCRAPIFLGVIGKSCADLSRAEGRFSRHPEAISFAFLTQNRLVVSDA
jgi:hypothetical protein